MTKYFIEQTYEAVVVDVDYVAGTCSLSPLIGRTDAIVSGVPLPYIAGRGIAGLFFGISKDSRVIAVKTSGEGPEVSVIVASLPEYSLYNSKFDKFKPIGTPAGMASYPDMAEGRIILRGGGNSHLSLDESGDGSLFLAGGQGLYLKRRNGKGAFYSVAEDILQFSNAGRTISGPVRRISGTLRNIFPKRSLGEMPLFVDDEYHLRAQPRGFFGGSKALKENFSGRKRNPEIAEHRTVFNEFTTDSMFIGFDKEVGLVKGERRLYDEIENKLRNREPSNALHLAEHELVEIIVGNVVGLNGEVYDINYRPVIVGDAKGQAPQANEEIEYERARRTSRRGIGYHFQLSTNATSNGESSSVSSLIFDVDKEGLVKFNIPKSTFSGNIPFPSIANFDSANDGVEVSVSYPGTPDAAIEDVPVTLRDKDGNAVIPDKNSQGEATRGIGLRFSDDTSYFPGGSNTVRINPTKYHNMYAAAERLIANKITGFIQGTYIDTESESGAVDQIGYGLPFEVPQPDVDADNDGKLESAYRFSVVTVSPGDPAIYTGGGVVAAGKAQGSSTPSYSNSFSVSQVDKKIQSNLISATKETRYDAGGKSLNGNFEGSIELSVGSDNFDQKSIILDTAGSIVAWLGKDAWGRSAVLQTDGEVLINIGGSYNGGVSMNPGRLDLRVNLTDKGFVGTEFNPDLTPEDTGSPNSESDILISLSKNGIIISGDTRGVPMIFRNRDSITIESTEGVVNIKGNEVLTTGNKKPITTGSSSGRNQ